ncbi:MAG: 4Fe-4S binding protein [Christensenellaceae bacterium]
MKRKIITIDQDKCNGCGLCVSACAEGAIGMVGGKAALLRDDYCDGLGNCLPVCPTDAISFEEREAAAFDEKAVKSAQQKELPPLACGCAGTHAKKIEHTQNYSAPQQATAIHSMLNQWPVQIKLVPTNAPYLSNAHLLIAADCTAFAYGDFHNKFIKNKITLIGCPKLDEGDYADKLTEILQNNNIKSITVVRMSVPCCGGIVNAVKTALQNSQKMIPWQVVTLSTDGAIIEESV